MDTQTEETVDYKDKFLRAAAELENARKRHAKELTAQFQSGKESAIKQLLPVVDSLQRAIQTKGKAKPSVIVQGLGMVGQQVTKGLEKLGVIQIPAKGLKFDPARHQAVSTVESDQEEGTVVEEVESGYTLDGQVMRPTMVVVAKKAAG